MFTLTIYLTQKTVSCSGSLCLKSIVCVWCHLNRTLLEDKRRFLIGPSCAPFAHTSRCISNRFIIMLLLRLCQCLCIDIICWNTCLHVGNLTATDICIVLIFLGLDMSFTPRLWILICCCFFLICSQILHFCVCFAFLSCNINLVQHVKCEGYFQWNFMSFKQSAWLV